MSDTHGPIDDLSYEELRMRVLNERTDDLVVLINRWSSLKRATNDASSLIRVWMTKLAPRWKGAAGRACLAELGSLARWTEQIAVAAGNNLVANEDLHRAVLRAQREMKALDTQPNNAPPPPALVTLDNERDRRPTAARDSRQPAAARIAKTLAWAYVNHQNSVNKIPESPPGSDDSYTAPTAALGSSEDSGGISSRSRHVGGGSGSQPGSDAGTRSFDPGPTLAGRPPGHVVAPDSSSAATPVRPVPAAGPDTAAGVLRWAAGGVPGSGQQASSADHGASTSSDRPALKGGRHPTGPSGRPPMGTHGAPLAPSASAPPRDGRRHGRGTELREDPEVWMAGINKPGPGTIGTPRRIATGDEQDAHIAEPPPPTHKGGRREGEFSTDEGARVNVRMGDTDG